MAVTQRVSMHSILYSNFRPYTEKYTANIQQVCPSADPVPTQAYGGADSFKESPCEHVYEEFSHFSERTSTVWTEGANGISKAWLRKNARVFACERARHVSGIELQFERLRVAAWAYRVAAWAYRVAA